MKISFFCCLKISWINYSFNCCVLNDFNSLIIILLNLFWNILEYFFLKKLVIFSNSFSSHRGRFEETYKYKNQMLQKGSAKKQVFRLFPSLCSRYNKESSSSSSMGFHFRDCVDCRASLKLLEQLPTPFIPRLPFPFHQIILSLPAKIVIFHFILKPQRSKAVFFFHFLFTHAYNSE